MAQAYALSNTNLISFDTASPTITTTTAITGVSAGETLVGIDFRPNNGLLYSLGVNATADTATLYVISQRTGVATPVGTVGGIAFAGTDLPDPATTGYGFDFNPANDRIRVTTGTGLNFRINPSDGTPVDSDANGGNGITPDSAINGGPLGVDATAYTNNQPNNGNVTTLYTLDAANNTLFIQNTPNGGTQTLGQVVTFNGNPLDFTSIGGFDITAGVNAPASNSAVTTGQAFAVLNVGGTTSIYSINLVTAQATLVGNIGNGATAVQGFAVQSDLGGIPAIALTADGTNLVRFNTATPGTNTTQALNLAGLVAGETLVALDFRPSTGQLYALGVNATANTGTLYLVDPQDGAVSIAKAGTASAITFAGADFPDPTTSGYGMDFNPTVDRIRITTDTGLNFRIRPDTGVPVDGDSGTPGNQPDTAINGLPPGSTGVSAIAYTNSYGQSLGGSGVTTLYTLDSISNSLFIQGGVNNSPNAGTQTSQHTVTLNGNPLDFSTVNGFDIPAGVFVTANGAVAFGVGYASLTVGGITSLYQIDLSTGAATNLGAIGIGSTLFAGFTLADALSAPIITSNGAGATASIAVAENGTAVGAVTAIDGDFQTPKFSIVGGADAAKFTINATTGVLAFLSAPNFEAPTDVGANNSYIVNVQASDGLKTDVQAITVNVTDVLETVVVPGTQGDDVLGVPAASPVPILVNALGGTDTLIFNFKLTDATVSYVGNKVIFDTASQHIEVTGVEKYVFTDGTADNADGSPLIDDLFYYSHNHDVWNAHVDADAHFNSNGWKEGRDPNAFFDTSVYLAINADVRASGANPLTQFDSVGWKEGRIASLNFDPAGYLAANPDVKAAGIDPLAHFLQFGGGEGRQPVAPTEYLAPNGFDYVYYLKTYADVLAAGIDPFQHFQTFGWKEGRNPNELFDTKGYLAAYADVKAAGVNPLDHYHLSGFKEGRDPSVGFDTFSYRSAYPDVAAANVDPLAHFLDLGRHEGRSAFADGIWG